MVQNGPRPKKKASPHQRHGATTHVLTAGEWELSRLAEARAKQSEIAFVIFDTAEEAKDNPAVALDRILGLFGPGAQFDIGDSARARYGQA